MKTLQNIMRKDPGFLGDAQLIEELGWLLFPKLRKFEKNIHGM